MTNDPLALDAETMRQLVVTALVAERTVREVMTGIALRRR